MNEHIRKCAGCNEKFDRKLMIKITKDHKTGEIIPNPDNLTFGRSIYVCKNQKCIEQAFKKGKFFKLLKSKPDETLKEKIATFISIKNA